MTPTPETTRLSLPHLTPPEEDWLFIPREDA